MITDLCGPGFPDLPLYLSEHSELALSLDKESVVLSKDNIAQGKARMGDNVEIGYGWVIIDTGSLT